MGLLSPIQCLRDPEGQRFLESPLECPLGGHGSAHVDYLESLTVNVTGYSFFQGDPLKTFSPVEPGVCLKNSCRFFILRPNLLLVLL